MAPNVGKSEVASLVAVNEAFVVDAQAVKGRCMKIVNRNPIMRGMKTKLVRGAICDAAFDATAGQPHGESMGMMVTPPFLATTLSHGCPAEFSTPDHQGILQHPALLQITN